MKLVYVAGPYRAKTAWGVEENIRTAELNGRLVATLGHMPIIPHANTRGYFEDLQSPEFWLAGTMELMRRCDAVLVTGFSAGVDAEIIEAQLLGLPVFHTLDDLRDWNV